MSDDTLWHENNAKNTQPIFNSIETALSKWLNDNIIINVYFVIHVEIVIIHRIALYSQFEWHEKYGPLE